MAIWRARAHKLWAHIILSLTLLWSAKSEIPIHLLKAEQKFNEALSFTSGHIANVNEKKGRVHMDILKRFGLNQGSRLLEIGCGALDLASMVVPYLEVDSYVCVEPNIDSVRDALYYRAGLLSQVLIKRALFINATDFHPGEAAGQRPFDFVFSHSVLSHAAWWQLPQYIWNTNRLMTPTGVSLASLYLHRLEAGKEGFIENYSVGDSNDECWVYPGISTFEWPTVKRMAARVQAVAHWDPLIKQYMLSNVPTDPHDWIVFRRRNQRRKLNASMPVGMKYYKTPNGEYCPRGRDVNSVRECALATRHLRLTWAQPWYGVGDHKKCVFADDRRKSVYFNTAGDADVAAKPPNRKYASICKAQPNKYEGYPEDLPTDHPPHCPWI